MNKQRLFLSAVFVCVLGGAVFAAGFLHPSAAGGTAGLPACLAGSAFIVIFLVAALVRSLAKKHR